MGRGALRLGFSGEFVHDFLASEPLGVGIQNLVVESRSHYCFIDLPLGALFSCDGMENVGWMRWKERKGLRELYYLGIPR